MNAAHYLGDRKVFKCATVGGCTFQRGFPLQVDCACVTCSVSLKSLKMATLGVLQECIIVAQCSVFYSYKGKVKKKILLRIFTNTFCIQ